MPSDQQAPAASPEPSAPRKARAPATTTLRRPDGSPLQDAQDVAKFLGTFAGTLFHVLYNSTDEQRYRAGEIPKKSGGMRQIHAPIGFTRTWQDKLAPVLAATYEAHPNAHGFLAGRSILSNATEHVGRPLVFNVDLKDFFPSVNFGRVRGLLMRPPFDMAPAAATIIAQLLTFKNGLPQGASTSPVVSNMIAAELDRRLSRLARRNRLSYTRYADDITFSTAQATMPASIVSFIREGGARDRAICGPDLAKEISASGFSVNEAKVRLQTRHQRQTVTGLTVNARANVERARIRQLRSMLHAWRKFGLEAAAKEYAYRYASGGGGGGDKPPEPRFRAAVYGRLSFVKMVRGKDDPVFLNLCAQLLDLDPNPSKFLKSMVFGAADYDVFISHAGEDKDAIARPIFEALEKEGIKAFLDEAHIGWGESFTKKINTALGAARYVLAIVSSHSVAKEWPVLEVNAALALEVNGQKTVVPLMVGRPDISKLPLIATKDLMEWKGDPAFVARRLRQIIKGDLPGAARRGQRYQTAVPPTGEIEPHRPIFTAPRQGLRNPRAGFADFDRSAKAHQAHPTTPRRGLFDWLSPRPSPPRRWRRLDE
jgi:RNA-directed DNA polymerase